MDDQPSVLASLAYVFTSGGFSVLLANRGAEAFTLIENQPVDAALVDVHMPVMDGLAVCRGLVERTRSRGRALPVWLMTAALTPELAALGRDAGAKEVLKKPFDSLALLATVEQALRAASAPPGETGAAGSPPPGQAVG